MVALRARLRVFGEQDLLVALVAVLATMLLGLAGEHKLGQYGLIVPLAAVLVVILLRNPVAMVSLTVGLAIMCEGSTFGFFHFTSHLYDQFYKGLTPLDVLVALTVVSTGWQLVRERRTPIIPRPLALPLVILLLAMIAGAVTGHGSGASIRSVVLSENVLAYLLLLPIVVVNLGIDRRQAMIVVGCLAGLAVFKAGLGMIEELGHFGEAIEGQATLTYYEPTANWLIMLTLLGVVGLALARVRPPLWLMLGTPLLVASLVLSYRRSFWIATIFALLLVIALGTSPVGRRMLLPITLLGIVAVLVLSSTHFQLSGPVGHRLASLSQSKIEANVEDRYRLNERANVLSEIGKHPITGLGMDIPWAADASPLSVEHPEGRLYVHFAALWFWLKLGILGLVAYLLIIGGALVLAWRAWRTSPEPPLRVFGLVSLCGVLSLLVIETTASFTGIDPRFTALLGAQLGLLALVGRLPAQSVELSAAEPTSLG